MIPCFFLRVAVIPSHKDDELGNQNKEQERNEHPWWCGLFRRCCMCQYNYHTVRIIYTLRTNKTQHEKSACFSISKHHICPLILFLFNTNTIPPSNKIYCYYPEGTLCSPDIIKTMDLISPVAVHTLMYKHNHSYRL